MEFNDLLKLVSIDPQQVIVLRHRPSEPELRKVLPWLAAERHDLYNAYPQTHGEKVEKAFLRATHVASFIGHTPGKALFIGLFKIGQNKELSFKQYWEIPAHQELKSKFGMIGFGRKRPSVLRFDLPATSIYAEWKGKLIVRWPPPERSWWRRAHKNVLGVEAIVEQSVLTAAMPPWNEMVFDWNEIEILPTSWRAVLSQWRGFYLIFDKSDGKFYVGSASGTENILGRWMNYATSQHGGNRLLKSRDPMNFSFSMLERVSPDMTSENVVRLENTWKQRFLARLSD